MNTTPFEFVSIQKSSIDDLEQVIRECYENITNKISSFSTFHDIVSRGYEPRSKDIKDNQQPEAFAKLFLIEPLLDFLGYEIITETKLPSPSGIKQPDYIIRPRGVEKPLFYVEAEHLNCNLYAKGYGIDQINDWLLSRASKTDYGVAVDGFQWILVKFWCRLLIG